MQPCVDAGFGAANTIRHPSRRRYKQRAEPGRENKTNGHNPSPVLGRLQAPNTHTDQTTALHKWCNSASLTPTYLSSSSCLPLARHRHLWRPGSHPSLCGACVLGSGNEKGERKEQREKREEKKKQNKGEEKPGMFYNNGVELWANLTLSVLDYIQ